MTTHHGGHLTDWEEWIKPTPPKPLRDRLYEKTKPGEIPKNRPELGACLVWTGHVAQSGYGTLAITKRKILAHRMAYELEVGRIPDGLVIDHLCENKQCVNPEHMEPVTLRENFRRSNQNLDKTHCPQGHPYSPENTRLKKGPYGFRRHCKTCETAHSRRYDAEHRKERSEKAHAYYGANREGISTKAKARRLVQQKVHK